LWPETAEAVAVALKCRRAAADPTDEQLLFITKDGFRYVRQRPGGAWIDSIGLTFNQLLRKLRIKQPGLSFYALRHTFRTIADEVNDPPAVDLLMGHETPGMGTAYREWTRNRGGREIIRLTAVTEHVRGWFQS
jgi:integrase